MTFCYLLLSCNNLSQLCVFQNEMPEPLTDTEEVSDIKNGIELLVLL